MADDNTLPTVDPNRHFLSLRDFRGKVGHPITLDEQALRWRERLAADRDREEQRAGELDRDVHLTELRGMVIGTLLRELAARLEPGAAFGPTDQGTALASLARDLADEVLDQTFVGRQR